MGRRRSAVCLRLHDHPAFNNQVQPVTAIEAHALIEHWKRHLPLKGQPYEVELIAKAFLVSRFEQAGPVSARM
jgi:hypothetical protein